jgi:hypothetical protein
MPTIEKHGGLWYEDPHDSRTLPLFEHLDPATESLAVVVRSPMGHFIASVFEKVADPQWSLPSWCERRPQGLFDSFDEAVEHSLRLLQIAVNNQKP